MKLADLEKIEKLLSSDTSAYGIEKETGVSRTTLSKYRNGDIPVKNMTFDTAIKLTNFYDNKQKEEIEMINTVESITTYLEEYEQTFSNAMDSKFGLFKSDVYSMAKDLASGDLYIYSKEEYIEFLEELIKDNIEYHISEGMTKEEALEEETEFTSRLKEVQESNDTVFIEKTGGDDYYSL